MLHRHAEVQADDARFKGRMGLGSVTGLRPRAFEAWCGRTGKYPAADDAQYAWLFLELSGVRNQFQAVSQPLVWTSRGERVLGPELPTLSPA